MPDDNSNSKAMRLMFGSKLPTRANDTQTLSGPERARALANQHRIFAGFLIAQQQKPSPQPPDDDIGSSR